MQTIKFITRNENGSLQQDLSYWDSFKEDLFSLAKNTQELYFIEQLLEDLQHEFDERLEELEENEE